MKTRITVAAVVAVVCTAGLLARTAERATFILTNGERVSGTVVFHTSEASNLRQDTNEWSLGKAEGGEIAIKGHQIAVIDFVGGKPSQAELDATRPGEQMIAMRDGTTKRGKIVDMLRGDTVRWERTDGDRENFPISSVRRVYMNVESARTIFDYQPSAAASPTASKPALNLTIPAGSGVAVPANTAWTDTGLTVRSGQTVKFSVTGKAGFGLDAEMVAGPGGNEKFKSSSYPVNSLPVGALIGRIGNSGQPFAIGSSSEVRIPTTGRLMLGVNDDNYNDNSGGFRVQVIR